MNCLPCTPTPRSPRGPLKQKKEDKKAGLRSLTAELSGLMSPFQERRPGTEVGTENAFGSRCTNSHGTATEIDEREKLDNEEDHVVTESDSSLPPVSSSSDTED